MKHIAGSFILTVFMGCAAFAQQDSSPNPAVSSAGDILLKQAQNKQDSQSTPQSLNERLKRMVRVPKTTGDYLLGPGDAVELTVVGIPGMDKKVFPLDGQGNISIPYVGQVELIGLNAHEAEAKLIKLYAASLLEDPQVTLSIKEYRSQYYYVMGAVKQSGKYPLVQSTDLLDVLASAGGLTEKAGSNIKIYRYSQKQAYGDSVSGNPVEISLTELLEKGQENDWISVLPGDVVEVPERKESTYYVLGDILRPGAFQIDSNRRMHLSRALANAGGMLKTASGKNVFIIRNREDGELPEQIKVNAYKVLKGDSKDVELCENDIVLVPGSASKTLGKGLVSGVGGLLGTLLLIAH